MSAQRWRVSVGRDPHTRGLERTEENEDENDCVRFDRRLSARACRASLERIRCEDVLRTAGSPGTLRDPTDDRNLRGREEPGLPSCMLSDDRDRGRDARRTGSGSGIGSNRDRGVRSASRGVDIRTPERCLVGR